MTQTAGSRRLNARHCREVPCFMWAAPYFVSQRLPLSWFYCLRLVSVKLCTIFKVTPLLAFNLYLRSKLTGLENIGIYGIKILKVWMWIQICSCTLFTRGLWIIPKIVIYFAISFDISVLTYSRFKECSV